MNLCVIGTGYVGLVTGSCFAHKGHTVVCVDKDAEKIRVLNDGGMPIYEPGLEDIVKACRKDGRLRFVTDIASAELIKHASNSFLATKISFINAVAVVCELSGADVQLVAQGMGLDPRIGSRFLSAGIGYGGSCFPKDVSAFEQIARELGFDFGMLREVQKVNREMRERFLRKVEEELWIVKGKIFGVWGLAFKPDTDDIREAPAIELIQRLVEKGAIVKAHDPQAMKKAQKAIPALTCCATAEEAAQGVDALLVCTEWPVFRDFPLAKLKGLLKHPLVLDGRNLYDPAAMKAAGFDYRCVGRG